MPCKMGNCLKKNKKQKRLILKHIIRSCNNNSLLRHLQTLCLTPCQLCYIHRAIGSIHTLHRLSFILFVPLCQYPSHCAHSSGTLNQPLCRKCFHRTWVYLPTLIHCWAGIDDWLIDCSCDSEWLVWHQVSSFALRTRGTRIYYQCSRKHFLLNQLQA